MHITVTSTGECRSYDLARVRAHLHMARAAVGATATLDTLVASGLVPKSERERLLERVAVVAPSTVEQWCWVLDDGWWLPSKWATEDTEETAEQVVRVVRT